MDTISFPTYMRYGQLVDETTRRRRQFLRTRIGIAIFGVVVVASVGIGLVTSVADWLHARPIVTRGGAWCHLQPGVASPAAAYATLGHPTTTGRETTSNQQWSEWKFHDVNYEITWFPGDYLAQELWASVTSQWGRLPCGRDRIDYAGWYQPTQPWQEPPDPGAFQPPQ